MISIIANLVYELPHVLPNDLILRILGKNLRKRRKMRKISNLGGDIVVPSLPSRNLTLAIAVKNHAKVDIKLFFSCLVLLDFSILSKYFAQDYRSGLWFLEIETEAFSQYF